MSDGMDPDNRPVSEFKPLKKDELISSEVVERLRNVGKGSYAHLSLEIKWLCDSYMTLVLKNRLAEMGVTLEGAE